MGLSAREELRVAQGEVARGGICPSFVVLFWSEEEKEPIPGKVAELLLLGGATLEGCVEGVENVDGKVTYSRRRMIFLL